MPIRMLILLVLSTFTAPLIEAQPRAGGPSLVVHITDTYGNRVRANSVILSQSSEKVEIFQDVTVQVRYGKFMLEVAVPGFKDNIISGVISQPNQVFNVPMKLSPLEGDSPACSIDGTLNPIQAHTSVRLMELFGTWTTEVPLSQSGTFKFRNLECGRYLLVFMDPTGCLGVFMSKAEMLPSPVVLRLNALGGCGRVPLDKQ